MAEGTQEDIQVKGKEFQKTEFTKKIENLTAELKTHNEEKKNLENKFASLTENSASKEDIDALKDQVSKLYEDKINPIEEAIEKMKNTSVPGLDDEAKMVAEGKKKYSIAKAMRAMQKAHTGGNYDAAWDDADAGYEREISDQYKKSFGVTDGSLAIPELFNPDVIERLRKGTVLGEVGARIINDLTTGDYKIPRMDTGVVGYWTPDKQSITESSNPDISQLTLEPHAATVLLGITNRSLMTMTPGIENLFRQDMAIQIGELVEQAGLRGTGTGDEPEGIINASGVNNANVYFNNGTDTAGFLDYDIMSDMQLQLDDANALKGNLAYVIQTRCLHSVLRKRIKQFSGDTYGVREFVSRAELEEALSATVRKSNFLRRNLSDGSYNTLAEGIFGNWNDFLIGYWGAVMLSVSTDFRFSSNETVFKAVQHADFGVRHKESFSVFGIARTDIQNLNS